MSRRALAVAFLVAAIGLEWGVAAPARRAASDLAAEHRRARELLLEARATLRTQQQRHEALARGEAFLARAQPLSSGESIGELRGRVVAALEGRPLSDLRIEVSPDRGSSDALLFVSARGHHAELLRLPGELVRAHPGIVLQRVSLKAGAADRVRMDFQARWMAAPPS